ncbi:MAG: hypothetical protein ACKVOL_07430 [Novosphingobium sp.]
MGPAFASELLERLTAEPQLDAACRLSPFERLGALIDPRTQQHYHLPEALRAAFRAVPETSRDAYGRAFLVWAIARFQERDLAGGFPKAFRAEFDVYLGRILADIEAGRYGWGVETDVYAKDLAQAFTVLVPGGAQLIFERAGLGLREVLRGGAGMAWHLAVRCGGRAPFMEIHTHDPMAASRFNPAGWDQTYALCAQLAARNPALRGLMGISWFYDPALADLSPRLAYLREVPMAGGARLLPMGSDQGSIDLATATSPSRRAAYAEGRYLPQRYAMIWPRRALMKACL